MGLPMTKSRNILGSSSLLSIVQALNSENEFVVETSSLGIHAFSTIDGKWSLRVGELQLGCLEHEKVTGEEA
jgi:hypothetical protein